jgi:catechol 2,3-dioxygenase-like lactoylglutathione lyase family enzyme
MSGKCRRIALWANAESNFRSDSAFTDHAMKFAYTIIYVPDVLASVEFFEKAFGLRRRFVHESGDYGELDTGATLLAFATHELGSSNLPGGYVKANQSDTPLGMEIALVTDNVAEAHDRAIDAGAVSIKEPLLKPWGQMVSYVRCPDGTLVEICSPVAG